MVSKEKSDCAPISSKMLFTTFPKGNQELFPVFTDEDEVIGDEKLGMVL
jgi:hypothetical protein